MTFGEKLTRLRTAKEMTVAGLAEKSGVTFAALREYGSGRRKPSFAAVVRIAAALGVTCDTFADCDDVAAVEPRRK